MKTETIDDLLAQTHPPDARGCRIWRRAIKASGYGHLLYHGRYTQAHRLAWSLANGVGIPDGMFVLHSCDVRACINPKHLHLGTAADNTREMMDRGRHHQRFALPLSRMDEVKALYQEVGSHRQVGLHFGISAMTVGNIVRGKYDDQIKGAL